ARSPEGWSHRFSERVGDAVLPGYSAFSLDDARRAADALLPDGPVRIKLATGIGGGGQPVAATPLEASDLLTVIDGDDIERDGLVIEQHLEDVTTYSVGQLEVNGELASYCGIQHLTRNNHDNLVYGGSDLTVARGDWDALLVLDVDATERCAVGLAQ